MKTIAKDKQRFRMGNKTDSGKAKPNIVYILADDMGYGDVSANNPGCPFRTPSLDAMCANGMRFTDAHASSAVCTPSRYSILTGRYNWRSILKSSVIGGYSEPLISEGRKTVADFLKAQGYWTGCIGKWHLGMSFAKTHDFDEKPDFAACEGVDYAKPIRRSPISNGFDYYYGISGSLDMPPYIYIENDRFSALPDHESASSGKRFWRKGPAAPDFAHEEVLDHLTDKALDSISRHRDKPFFIYFAMPAPHTPILPSKRFLGKSGTNEYGDFVLHCDDVVGRITSKLSELGIADNTIVIFTSDNGCSPMADFAELKACGHNPSYIFRGSKADIYEGGHRIPLIVQWPETVPKGTSCNALVCLSDLLATLSDILGFPLPPDAGEDSVSNLPLWKGLASEVRSDLVHQSIDGSLSIRKGRWKLEMCPGSGGWSYPAPGKDDISALPSFQLYDLENDIGERDNIIEQHQDAYLKLRQLLKKQILDGRSTPGPRQQNEGQRIWETVKWLEENDSIKAT